MSSPLFSYHLRDLENGPKDLDQPVPASWIDEFLGDAEASSVDGQAGRVKLSLTLQGREVIVRGRIGARVAVPCARTLDPAVYELEAEVFLLLGPEVGAGARHTGALYAKGKREGAGNSEPYDGSNKKGKSGAGPSGHGKGNSSHGKGNDSKKAGKSRDSGGGSWDDDPLLDLQDAARDSYAGDEIVLDPFLREFLLLELPMVPLREDLRSEESEANPSPPGGLTSAEPANPVSVGQTVDPRLSPLLELKARLEKKE